MYYCICVQYNRKASQILKTEILFFRTDPRLAEMIAKIKASTEIGIFYYRFVDILYSVRNAFSEKKYIGMHE